MKKEITITTISSGLDWSNIQIDTLIEDLKRDKYNGATHANVQFDDDCIDISTYARRMETDEEFEVRKKKFEEYMEIKEQIDRAKYEELKKKFEGK